MASWLSSPPLHPRMAFSTLFSWESTISRRPRIPSFPFYGNNIYFCFISWGSSCSFDTSQSWVSWEARPALLSEFSLSAGVSIWARCSSLSRKTQEARQPLGSLWAWKARQPIIPKGTWESRRSSGSIYPWPSWDSGKALHSSRSRRSHVPSLSFPTWGTWAAWRPGEPRLPWPPWSAPFTGVSG